MQKKKLFAFVNREIRRVPPNWSHPVDGSLVYIPLQDRRFLTPESLADDLAEGRSREENESHYMPDFSNIPPEQMGIQAYETTTEGTPISPIFPDTPEGRFQLVSYLAVSASTFAMLAANEQEWAHILFGKDQAVVDMETGTVELLQPDPWPN